jgi:hypothetical protein
MTYQQEGAPAPALAAEHPGTSGAAAVELSLAKKDTKKEHKHKEKKEHKHKDRDGKKEHKSKDRDKKPPAQRNEVGGGGLSEVESGEIHSSPTNQPHSKPLPSSARPSSVTDPTTHRAAPAAAVKAPQDEDVVRKSR